jgi:aminoglycoside 3-N-acetyltransferase
LSGKVDPASLVAAWNAAGVERGDVVLLHASAKRTLLKLRCADPRILLGTFLDALGPGGTLLLPLFNFDFTYGAPFDIRATPSQMGALTEAGRRHPRAVRTGHPIYSFAAIGARARDFAAVNNRSGYGPDSPFALRREMNGKIAVLDLDDQNSMTFYHHVEEMAGAPYRFFKAFTGAYTDVNGLRSMETYRLFVRDLAEGVRTDVNRCGALLWQAGLYRGEQPGAGAGLRTIEARALFDFTTDIIESGRAEGLLYSIAREVALT